MKIKLDTVQTENKLNEVYAVGDKGPGGAYHTYDICTRGNDESIVYIDFQKGARFKPDSTTGVLIGDLLEIVRHQLQCFQEGEYACDANEAALDGVTKALVALNFRSTDRASRGVLSKEEK